jgi:hypothetical protein
MPQLHGVTSLDWGFRTRSNHITRADALGRNDVTALAVGIQHQSQMHTAIRIVLKTLDLAFDAILVAQKIDQAIFLLVTPPL